MRQSILSKVAHTIFISLISLSLLSCSGDDGPTGGGEMTFHDISVSVNPSGAGTIAPSADDSYEAGETISLQAEAAEGYLFVGWDGDEESTDNPLSLTVDKDYSLTANFELKNYELTVNTEGEGEVTEQVVTQKSTDYDHGTTVELEANPEHGWSFVEWQGDITGTDTLVTVTVNTEMTITAVFDSPFAGGTGTEADPFQISTIEQLQAIDNPEYISDHFMQINDIDASATAGGNNGITYTPISLFYGSYDGQDYVISDLYINSTNSASLFGTIGSGGEISNVKLINVDITGGSMTGSLIGQNNGEVTNSSATGTVHCIDDRCGGLAGNNGGLIGNSYADVEVTSTDKWVGGLVGYNRSEIRTSFALGNVSGKESIGGLVGATDDAATNGFEHRIYRSYARGEVEGDDWVGGLAGYQFEGSYISHCYASGKVTLNTGHPSVGGLIGQAEDKGLVERCYWDQENSGQTEAISGGDGDSDVTGLTTAEMTGTNAETNMPQFNFGSIWQVVDSNYPALFWEYSK